MLHGHHQESSHREIARAATSLNHSSTTQFDPALFDAIPVGLLTLDQRCHAISSNVFAQEKFGINPGADVVQSLHSDCVQVFKDFLHGEAGNEIEIQLQHADASFHTRCRLLGHDNDNWVLSLEDATEVNALASQLKAARQPERRFVHDISNALTTTIGYTELIKMMIEEHDELSGERLAAVRRYQDEVFTGLRKADALIKNRRQGAASQISPAVPIRRKHVVVVDDEPQITEFLSELLSARHYKVTAFTSGIEALDYYKEHGDKVDLVIMDQMMPEMSGISLATELLAVDLHQPIVLCTGDEALIEEQSIGKLRIRHFLSKPIDINELTDMVSSIVDESN